MKSKKKWITGDREAGGMKTKKQRILDRLEEIDKLENEIREIRQEITNILEEPS